jgi:chemotaxis response regulator CheB
MPKAAVELGAATRQASLERMAPTILSFCNAHRTETH